MGELNNKPALANGSLQLLTVSVVLVRVFVHEVIVLPLGVGLTELVPSVTVCTVETGRLIVVLPPEVILKGTVPAEVPAHVTLPVTDAEVKFELQAELAQAVMVKVSGEQVTPFPSWVMSI